MCHFRAVKPAAAMVLCGMLAVPARADCAGVLFAPPARHAVGGRDALLLTDLDGDGHVDILTSGNSVDQLATFSFLRNRGDGTFTAAQPIASRLGERIEDAADRNGGAGAEILVSHYWANGIAVYRDSALAVAFDTATHGGPTRAADYDRDGILDIVSFSFGSGNPVRVHLFRGRGDGTFEPKRTFDTPFAVAASPSMRMHDGAVEFLANEHSGRLVLFRVTGSGVGWSVRDAAPGFDLESLFADVNGDGIEDIVDTTDGDSPLEPIFITLGNADGGFGGRRQVQVPRRLEFPALLAAGDVDGDRRIDLVAGDFRASTLYFYRGDGAGNFAEGIAFDVGGPANEIAVGDVNRDGRPDVVTANEDRSVSVILNRCAPARRRAVAHEGR